MSDNPYTKALMQHKKDEIVEAMCRTLSDEKMAQILDVLCDRQRKKSIENWETTLRQKKEAEKAYREWWDEMAELYGIGRRVVYDNIPAEEMTYGLALERNFAQAERAYRRAEKKMGRVGKRKEMGASIENTKRNDT